MKKTFLLLFQLAFTGSLLAQYTFEKAHRRLTFWPEIARSCDNDDKGGYVVASGEKLLNSTQRTNALYRMNAFGDTLWYFTYPLPSNSNFQFTRKTIDGNFYVAGIEPDTSGNTTYMWWIIKVDSMGNFLWKKNYFQLLNNFSESGNSMQILPDGNLFLLLFDRAFLRIDTGGILINQFENSNFVTYPYAHLKRNFTYLDTTLYFLGYYNSILPYRIMKSNFSGDTIASIPLQVDTGKNEIDLLKTDLINYYTCSFALPFINGKHPFTFSKFDSTGAKIWNKFYSFINGGQYLATNYSALLNGKNIASFIPGTNGIAPPTGKAALFCFNDNGDSLWYKQVSPSDTSAKTEIFDVLATPDSGLLAVGQILFNNGQQKSYALKLDANGNLFNPLGIVEKSMQSYLHIYPNPAQTYTGIHYLGNDTHVQLRICNLQGIVLNSWLLQNKEERVTINLENYRPGIYCIQLVKDGQLLKTKKLSVVKL